MCRIPASGKLVPDHKCAGNRSENQLHGGDVTSIYLVVSLDVCDQCNYNIHDIIWMTRDSSCIHG